MTPTTLSKKRPSKKSAAARETTALTLDRGQGGSDYTLRPEHRGCWITVDGIAVHVYRVPDDTGVQVDLLPVGGEDNDVAIDTAFALHSQALPEVPEELEALNRKAAEEAVARTGGSEEGAEDCPCKVGDVRSIKAATFTKPSGGTELVDVRADVKILGRWNDYETGRHFVAEIQRQVGAGVSRFSREIVPVPQCVFVSEFDLVK